MASLFPTCCLLALLVSAPPPTLAAPQGQTQARAKEAIYGLLQQRRYAEAETSARAYLAQSSGNSPQDCSIETMLGIALHAQSRDRPAFDAFQRAIGHCPQSPSALEGAAEIAYTQQMPEAEGLLNRLLQLHPQDATAHAMQASLQARAGNCAGAVENYHQSASQIQHNVVALRQYGGCLLALGRAPEAVEVFERVLAIEDAPASREVLARALMDAGRRSDALGVLAPLLQENSREDRALLLGAQIKEADNKTPEAIEYLRRAMQIAPERIENYLYFAELSLSHGSYQTGIDFLNLGLVRVPGNARLHLARGVLEVLMSKQDAALSDFEDAHRLDPKLSFAEDAMGMLYSQQHDISAALALFESRSRQQPNDALLQYLYAEALSQSAVNDASQTDAAIAAAKRALNLEPSYQPARDLLCVMLLRRGDFEGVIRQAEEATRRDPFDETALYQALLAERRLKHPEKIEDLVRRLQQAKAKNQAPLTKYVLEEGAKP